MTINGMRSVEMTVNGMRSVEMTHPFIVIPNEGTFIVISSEANASERSRGISLVTRLFC